MSETTTISVLTEMRDAISERANSPYSSRPTETQGGNDDDDGK